MKKIAQNNILFLLPFFIIWLGLSVVLLVFSKSEIHLWMNSFHTPVADVFFKYVTHLGDGLVALFFVIVFLFISYRKTLILAVSGILSALIVQSLKHVFFKDILRPKSFFKGLENLYLLSEIEIHSRFSFPSGHTATAFFLYLLLASFIPNKGIKLAAFILAAIVGYSRIYLSQHFLLDVFFGAIIGVIIAMTSLYFFEKLNNQKLDNSLLKHR